MSNLYFNEIDPFAAAWLGNLFPSAVIDQRSITDVKAADLAGYDRVHLFGGIGGWELALHLAGWPADWPAWTGSCPCQPYSAAGKQKGQADARHLWPEMFRLIRECRPPVVFGEQVEAAIRFGWLDGVFADLEREGYACGAIVLGAHSVGAPHARQRIYWVSNADMPGQHEWASSWEQSICHSDSELMRVGNTDGAGSQSRRPAASIDGHRSAAIADGRIGGLGESFQSRLEGLTGDGDGGHQPRRIDPSPPRSVAATGSIGGWDNYDLIPCRDGKTRRVESGTFPLAHGVPNRVGRLRGYGNAIVPQVAAEFVRAFLETQQQ